MGDVAGQCSKDLEALQAEKKRQDEELRMKQQALELEKNRHDLTNQVPPKQPNTTNVIQTPASVGTGTDHITNGENMANVSTRRVKALYRKKTHTLTIKGNTGKDWKRVFRIFEVEHEPVPRIQVELIRKEGKIEPAGKHIRQAFADGLCQAMKDLNTVRRCRTLKCRANENRECDKETMNALQPGQQCPWCRKGILKLGFQKLTAEEIKDWKRWNYGFYTSKDIDERKSKHFEVVYSRPKKAGINKSGWTPKGTKKRRL